MCTSQPIREPGVGIGQALQQVAVAGGPRATFPGAGRLLASAGLGLTLIFACGSSNASVFEELETVDDSALAEMRGGFDLGSGISVSFGLTRDVSINGELVTSTSFHIPDISQLTAAQAVTLAAHRGTMQIVQNGALNTVSEATRVLGTGGGTIIQNTLNNQSIKSLTTIDATVNSLGILKGGNAQTALRDALMNAIPTR